MKEEVKDSLFVSIVKFLLTLIVSWLVVVICFSIAVDDLNSGKYDKFILIGGFLLALAISLIRSYNKVQNLKLRIPKLQADIKSVKKMRSSLIGKANKVVDKYIVHESNVMSNIAKSRTFSIDKVETASDFRTIIEDYPDLKANGSITKLLEQLENAEMKLLKYRTDYSTAVFQYNTKIHTFPFSLVRAMFKLDDILIEDDEEEVVSDEELGI